MPTIDLFSPEFERDPYPFFKVMRNELPLFFDEGTGSYVVSRFEDVRRVLQDPIFTVKNYVTLLLPTHGGPNLLQMTGPEHTRKRNILKPSFYGAGLPRRVLPIITANASALIDAFRHRGEVDLAEAFTQHLPLLVVMDLLALPRRDYPQIFAWMQAFSDSFANLRNDATVFAAAVRAGQEYKEYLRPFVAARRARPGDDLLSLFCTIELDGARMTDDEVFGYCSLMLDAGTDQPDKTLVLLLRNLLQHPSQLEEVRRDRSLVERAIAETMRYSPSNQILQRLTSEPVELSGGRVPAGALVTCMIGAAHRDEAAFDRPDVFDLHRGTDVDVKRSFTAAAHHAGFSLGRHFCVGAMVAKAELQIALDMLLDAMPDLHFADGVCPPERGVVVRTPRTLPVRFTPVARPRLPPDPQPVLAGGAR